eukprot:scaffold192360_cov30-Tisochrysis_lutea.AAC.2
MKRVLADETKTASPASSRPRSKSQRISATRAVGLSECAGRSAETSMTGIVPVSPRASLRPASAAPTTILVTPACAADASISRSASVSDSSATTNRISSRPFVRWATRLAAAHKASPLLHSATAR